MTQMYCRGRERGLRCKNLRSNTDLSLDSFDEVYLISNVSSVLYYSLQMIYQQIKLHSNAKHLLVAQSALLFMPSIEI